MTAPYSSSFSDVFDYDVFLNFRGTDTRYGFIGYLYSALCKENIRTFIDDEEIQKGEEITAALEKAIQGSGIFITVFSENYASSSFCLNELTYILKCSKRNDLLVLPVFYKVDPSDLRHHKGSFGKALAKHEERLDANNMDKLEAWKKALSEVADISGYTLEHGDGYEFKFTESIVKLVASKIKRTYLHVANYPVGLKSQIQEVEKLLDVQSGDVVHMVGIHGIGGIGKTTLALAVHNSIAKHFDSVCFLQDVRENSNGKLKEKKVLLILDDVDKQEQLLRELNWLGPGSRVIMTTRDKQLLARHNVERTYEVKELNDKDAIQLLHWNAFKSEKVDPNYVNVLNSVATYAAGLPLALEVLGSNLFGKSIKEWESDINQYKSIPSKEILKMLRVSFDPLEEKEQNVFLDIACCFNGYDLVEVKDILHAHYGSSVAGQIKTLFNKSLIKIIKQYPHDMVILHDLIEAMGKEIVRQKSPTKLGARTRLWFHEDIVQVLEQNMGTEEIDIIHLQFPFLKEEEVKWDGKALKEMTNLKTLIIKNGYFSEGPKHLPNSLRVLEWWSYPSENLPRDFRPKKLGICKFADSGLSTAPSILKQELENLTSLNFFRCENLTEIPDVSSLKCLEKLSFDVCTNLSMIHDSVGLLNKLKILSTWACAELRSFPPIKLTSLEKLEFYDCGLCSFPEVLEKMENIKELVLGRTPIKHFPLSFENLIGLQSLCMEFPGELSDYEASSFLEIIAKMPKLTDFTNWDFEKQLLPKEKNEGVQRIFLCGCKLTDAFFRVVARGFSNVKELILSRNNFIIVPECIKECHFLLKLNLHNCKFLKEIRGIPPNMKHFEAEGSKSLTSSCRSMLLNKELHGVGNTKFILPITNIPEWFEHRSEEASISFKFRNKFPALVLCFVVALNERGADPLPIDKSNLFLIINDKKYSLDLSVRGDHTCLVDLREIALIHNVDATLLENEWNQAEFRCECCPCLSVKSGIHLRKKECNVEDFTPSSNSRWEGNAFDYHCSHAWNMPPIDSSWE